MKDGSLFLPTLPRSVALAQALVESRLGQGGRAVDATVGNGYDTRFLADLVGVEGMVVGFDIQAEAIAGTREKTASCPQVRLIHDGHENVLDHVEDGIDAAMFNLGYLPRFDKSVITRPETTVAALKGILSRLVAGGIITIVLYTGHEGGAEEAAAVGQWVEGLDQDEFSAIEYRFINQRNSPPSLIAIERKL